MLYVEEQKAPVDLGNYLIFHSTSFFSTFASKLFVLACRKHLTMEHCLLSMPSFPVQLTVHLQCYLIFVSRFWLGVDLSPIPYFANYLTLPWLLDTRLSQKC